MAISSEVTVAAIAGIATLGAAAITGYFTSLASRQARDAKPNGDIKDAARDIKSLGRPSRRKRAYWLVAAAACALTIVLATVLAPRLWRHEVPAYPQTLVFSAVASGDKTSLKSSWEAFRVHLQSKADWLQSRGVINRPIKVVSRTAASYDEQLDALRNRQTQVFALSAGTTATAVEDPVCNFRPVFVLVDTANVPITYMAIFIVKRGAGISTLQELASYLDEHPKEAFGLGEPTSNSSYRIPFIALKTLRHELPSEWNTRPNISHSDLIADVARGDLCAACVASDQLERSDWNDQLQRIPWPDGGLPPELSHQFPSVAFGWRNDLPIPLQLCVEEAFDSYDWRADPGFKAAYQKQHPEVGGVRHLERFWSTWRDVLEINRLFEQAKR